MAFLTLFSAPKPFSDAHINTIQRNAIRSWRMLGEAVQIILVGEESGLVEASRELGVMHLPQVRRNSQGTPLVSSIFDLARQAGDSPLLGYVNADILLMPDFLSAARDMASHASHFLLAGQRWDLEVTGEMDFAAGWDERLKQECHLRGRLHLPAGSDYFIFPRGCYSEMPDFAIGRAGWDNWMIFQARRQGWLAVDASESITIVHQQHDYAHLPGGKSHHHLPETEENTYLAGGREITRFSLLDMDHRLIKGRLAGRRWTWSGLQRTIETLPLLKWNNYPLTARITSLFHRFKFKFQAS